MWFSQPFLCLVFQEHQGEEADTYKQTSRAENPTSVGRWIECARCLRAVCQFKVYPLLRKKLAFLPVCRASPDCSKSTLLPEGLFPVGLLTIDTPHASPPPARPCPHPPPYRCGLPTPPPRPRRVVLRSSSPVPRRGWWSPPRFK